MNLYQKGVGADPRQKIRREETSLLHMRIGCPVTGNTRLERPWSASSSHLGSAHTEF